MVAAIVIVSATRLAHGNERRMMMADGAGPGIRTTVRVPVRNIESGNMSVVSKTTGWRVAGGHAGSGQEGQN